MLKFVIDIESCPAQDPAVLDAFRKNFSANFKAPSGLTKEQAAADLGMTDKDTIKFTSKDSMLALWGEKFKVEGAETAAQEAWRKTSFDGSCGHICVIGVAVDDEPPIALCAGGRWVEDERTVLGQLFDLIDSECDKHPNVRPTFIGHNVIDFDLRFIFQRAVILGIEPSRHIPFSARPWDDAVYDTMTRWAGTKDRIKLDKLAKALGLAGKGDIDGSMVWDYVNAGRIQEVAEYCCDDVSMTRDVWRRMTFNQLTLDNAGDIPF